MYTTLYKVILKIILVVRVPLVTKIQTVQQVVLSNSNFVRFNF